MLSFENLRRWRYEPLDDVEELLRRRSDTLLGLADEIAAAARPEGWFGVAADAAGAVHRQLADTMEEIVAGVNAVRTALMAASDVTG